MPASTRSTTLFSLSAVKAFMEIAASNETKDALLAALADTVSERVEAMTGRVWVTRTVTDEYHDARGRTTLSLARYPVVALSALSRRSTLTDAWESVVDDAEVDLDTGLVHLKTLSFYDGPRTAKATYTAGFGAQDAETLPYDVVGAALEWVKFCWKRLETGIITSSASAAGFSFSTVPRPPQDVLDALARRARRRV